MFYLPCDNEYFIRYLFPSVEAIKMVPETKYRTNAIKHKRVILFSAQGSGKTELVRSIAEEAVRIYGRRNVNPVMIKGDLMSILSTGLNRKLVQLVFVDDFTIDETPTLALKAYFNIRHLWSKMINRNYGLIVTIFAQHRFHSSSKEIRSTADVVIIRDDSLNPFDHSLIKRFIGEAGLSDLHLIQEYRDLYPVLKNYSIFRTRTGRVGLIYFPMAKENYLRRVKHVSRFTATMILSKYVI